MTRHGSTSMPSPRSLLYCAIDLCTTAAPLCAPFAHRRWRRKSTRLRRARHRHASTTSSNSILVWRAMAYTSGQESVYAGEQRRGGCVAVTHACPPERPTK